MKILVLNSGSSSIKYQLFGMPGDEVLAKGLVQRIGEPAGELEQQTAKGKFTSREPVVDHTVALEKVAFLLTRAENAPLADISEIGAVGHRVVHGGEHFTKSCVITKEIEAAIQQMCALAPLHNPPALLGIRAAQQLLPSVPQVAVFDTAFHQTIPQQAYLYALPLALYEKDRIRRYGFHGTSHRYVAARAAEILKKPADQVNLITCHLGNGCSMAAVRDGKSVDTTMGLTPLEGLVMGTRTGDIDPAIIFHLQRVKQMSCDQIDKLMNKQSGLLGVSGKSNDVRELLTLREQGHAAATLALDIFCYRIKKYIGAYLAVLGRTDAIVYTGGIGEHAAFVREQTSGGLENLGVRLDPAKNGQKGLADQDISQPGSPVKILVVPTNEEKLIALDTFALTQG